jgi:hypothetical protein
MGSDHTEDNSGGEGPKDGSRETIKRTWFKLPSKKLIFFLMIALIDICTQLLVKRKDLLNYEYLECFSVGTFHSNQCSGRAKNVSLTVVFLLFWTKTWSALN